MRGLGGVMRRRPLLALLGGAVPSLAVSGALATASEASPYETGLVRWRGASGGFGEWELEGVRREADGSLALDPDRARPAADPYPPGGYRGGDYYNGGAFLAGEAT